MPKEVLAFKRGHLGEIILRGTTLLLILANICLLAVEVEVLSTVSLLKSHFTIFLLNVFCMPDTFGCFVEYKNNHIL